MEVCFRKLSLSLLDSRWRFWKLTLLICKLGMRIVELDGWIGLSSVLFYQPKEHDLEGVKWQNGGTAPPPDMLMPQHCWVWGWGI